MKITLVRPNMSDSRSGDALEPYVFAIIAGLTPPDNEIVLYDERLEPVPVDETTDLVAMTVEIFTARRAYALAEAYRRRGVPVVMGGFHPTLLPNEAAKHATSVVIGDAETVWPRVIADARRQRLRPIYRAVPPSLPHMRVDRSIFETKPYNPLSIVQYGRGCPFACDFCSIRAFYRGNIEHRPVDDVVSEIGGLERKTVLFADDNLVSRRERALELFEALAPLGIRWAGQVSLEAADDRELLRGMARSGCFCAVIGFESLDESNLVQMNKGWNRGSRRYSRAIAALKDHGIMTYGTFVFGYDADTRDTVSRSVDYAIENRLFRANFMPLTPTPATPVYDRLAAEGRLIYDRWWLEPGFRYGQVPYRPRRIAPVDLEMVCHEARVRFNSFGSIWQRSRGVPLGRHWLSGQTIHWLTNLISKREIAQRQGILLGGDESP